MKKGIYIGLALFMLFTGCDKADEGRGEGGEKAHPVGFTLAGLTTTRADDGKASLSAGTELTIAAYDPNTHNLVVARNYKVNSGGNALELDDSEAMYLSVGTYDFCAMTPRQTLTGAGRKGTIGQGVDALGSVTRAQMEAGDTNIKLADLDHLASQVSFTVQVVKQKLDGITSFAVQSIELENMVAPATGNYLLPENKLNIPDTGNEKQTITGFTAGEKGNGDAPGFINKQNTPLVVFPKAESTFSAVVGVKVKKKDESNEAETKLNVKINRLAFEPGKRYNFEVNYGWDYVRLDITIADWTTVTDKGEAGSGEKTVSHTIQINPWKDDVNLDMTL